MGLERYKFKEVYVAGTDHTVASGGDLIGFDSLESLLDYLKEKNPSICGTEIRVVHGVLTPARSIPANFESQTIFILIEDSFEEGLLLDSSAETPEELAGEIEKALNSSEMAAEMIDIDDVFILYGHELNVCLSVDEEDIDEDIIETCLKVAKAAEEQLRKAGES
jgi:hypothetical protein